jgi:hypothetical protein
LSALINCAIDAGKSNNELILKAGLKMLARGKHSSLFHPVVSYKEKKCSEYEQWGMRSLNILIRI